MDHTSGSLLHSLLGPACSELSDADPLDGWRISHGDPARLPAPLRAAPLADVHALTRVYRGRVAFTRGPQCADMVPMEQANAAVLWQMGLTLYFPDIAACVPGMDALLRQIEAEFGVRAGSARSGAFASPPGDGLACHYDAEEVISIQLAGAKRFHLAPVDELPCPSGMQYSPGIAPYDELYPQVAGRFPDWRTAHFTTVDMQPGSVLFMPRGTWHRSEALSDSLAVSIILRPPTLLDSALEQLRLLLMQDPHWRRPMYGLDTNAITARLATLAPRAATLRSEDILTHNLSEPERIARIDAHSRFQTNPVAAIEVDGAHRTAAPVTLRIKTRDDRQGERVTAHLQIAPAAVPLFEWLAARSGPFTAQETAERFPAFPLSEHLELLKTAARGQLVKVLWYPAWRASP